MQKKLSKIMFLVLAVFLIGTTIPFNASAASLETTGAVKNEYTYEEAVFLSGTPVIFKGTSKDIKINFHKEQLLIIVQPLIITQEILFLEKPMLLKQEKEKMLFKTQ